ncbi:MAG: hypothetical protein K6U79_00905 [Firmicutes bacterium]|nr:hypothetical protein [Bacillota bacterium]
MLLVYPLVVALVCALFGYGTLRQYLERRRPHQLLWTVSLAMGFLGAVGYLLALRTASLAWFRIYYLFGAMLMAAYLGLGSLFLHDRGGRWSRPIFWLVLLLSLAGAVALFRTPGDAAAVARLDGGPGTQVLALDRNPAALVLLILLNTFGLVAVAGLALLSAWQLSRKQASGAFTQGNALIALGTILLGAAGSLARLGQPAWFWPLMALGFVVLYGGFARVNAAAGAARQATAGPAAPGTGR